jgi:hypothetical protein
MKKERFDDKKVQGGNGWGDALKSMGTLCICTCLFICIYVYRYLYIYM